MSITVKFFAGFREAIGKRGEVIEGINNIVSLIDELVRRFGEKLAERLYSSNTRELRKTVHILVSTRKVNFLQKFNTPLKDENMVAIFPPVAGG